ncbi:MAG TPA: DegV family protein [Anaerolineales bacterium]
MTKVALVTDSTTFLPKEYLDQYVIRVVPVMIIWNGEALQDGVDIQPEEFYTRLESAAHMPTTSQPSPADIKEVFEDLLSAGYDILGIFISRKLSGTFASAEQALSMMPGRNIEIIDSRTGSMGAGWPILAAARAAAEGASLAECRAIAENALDEIGILLLVESLEYLHRGGRIGTAQRFLGTALSLKPILEVVEGEFLGLERVRTHRKALYRLVELLIERIGDRSPVHLAVLHANAIELAEQLLEQAAAKVNPKETLIASVSPAVGAHLGPGTVGFAFMIGVA